MAEIILEETTFSAPRVGRSTVFLQQQESKIDEREEFGPRERGILALRTALYSVSPSARRELRAVVRNAKANKKRSRCLLYEDLMRALSSINVRLSNHALADLRVDMKLDDIEDIIKDLEQDASMNIRRASPNAQMDARCLAKQPFAVSDETNPFWIRQPRITAISLQGLPRTPRVLRRSRIAQANCSDSIFDEELQGYKETSEEAKSPSVLIGGRGSQPSSSRRGSFIAMALQGDPEGELAEITSLYMSIDSAKPPTKKQLRALEAQTLARPNTPEFIRQAQQGAKSYTKRARSKGRRHDFEFGNNGGDHLMRDSPLQHVGKAQTRSRGVKKNQRVVKQVNGADQNEIGTLKAKNAVLAAEAEVKKAAAAGINQGIHEEKEAEEGIEKIFAASRRLGKQLRREARDLEQMASTAQTALRTQALIPAKLHKG
mmetsp:Transcript_10707/g.18280  ORF Transcript_10707/g.18280 Transcript_10707/m.18280 type:complete len:432 (-) Transcript_10707:1801-3096(-)